MAQAQEPTRCLEFPRIGVILLVLHPKSQTLIAPLIITLQTFSPIMHIVWKILALNQSPLELSFVASKLFLTMTTLFTCSNKISPSLPSSKVGSSTSTSSSMISFSIKRLLPRPTSKFSAICQSMTNLLTSETTYVKVGTLALCGWRGRTRLMIYPLFILISTRCRSSIAFGLLLLDHYVGRLLKPSLGNGD